MRGTLRTCSHVPSNRGIIPAYAGNTRAGDCKRPPNRDHPRVCGEHSLKQFLALSFPGSSPRMRGTLGKVALAALLFGIIPAYAGNTFTLVKTCFVGGDHPRVCGEHPIVPHSASVPMGSSPRMRGTLHIRSGQSRRAGIIPAYAGNTRRGQREGRGWRDHPRVCGEHSSETSRRALSAGSSPRMRGTPVSVDEPAPELGIIPAYAGNTHSLTEGSNRWRDHPRVCGEHLSADAVTRYVPGSSPRMRGTHGWF